MQESLSIMGIKIPIEREQEQACLANAIIQSMYFHTEDWENVGLTYFRYKKNDYKICVSLNIPVVSVQVYGYLYGGEQVPLGFFNALRLVIFLVRYRNGLWKAKVEGLKKELTEKALSML